MSELELRLFGPPRLVVNGTPKSTERRKALALLAYLAVEHGQRGGAGHGRETLAALLWPGYEMGRALAYLRRAVWEINQVVGEGWVTADRDTVALTSAGGDKRRLWVDVTTFRQCLAEARLAGRPSAGNIDPALHPLAQAAQLYADHFLAGFSLKDAPDFDEWVFFQAEALRRDYAIALDRLTGLYQAAGQWEQAVQTARQWLRLDAYNEEAHRRLMRLYYQSGQSSAALAHYQDMVRLLRAELDVVPQSETVALYEEIRAGSGGHGSPAVAGGVVAAPQPESGAPEVAPPSKLPQALPAAATPFVGRRAELEEIDQLLNQPDCRLLTLTGQGGAGKTRLALECATRARQAAEAGQGAFVDGVYFVPLAPVADPIHIVPAIADAVGFAFFGRPEQDDPLHPQRQLFEFLREKRLLLVLDNFEHLMAGTPLIIDLLRNTRYVKLLTTSRERFNLAEEWVLAVAGMSFPLANGAAKSNGTAADYETYSAVQLLIQNARKVSAGFKLGAEDWHSAARICQLVEGLPLGLEIAAAWTKTLSLREIAAEMERSLDFLASPMRNAPERHYSLRVVFDYSWGLLTAQEQAIFQRLAVFQGGFDRAAAAGVAGADLAMLASLVDKSLLYRLPTGRYWLHQALKQFAAERLAENQAEEHQTRSRHSAYYGEYVRTREPALKGHGQMAALEQLGREVENIRAGLAFAASHAGPAEVAAYVDGLYLYFDIRSRLAEGEELLRQVLAVIGPKAAQSEAWAITIAKARAWRSWFCWRTARPGDAFEEGRTALAELRRLKARTALAYVNLVVPIISREEAEHAFAESMAYFEETGDQWGKAQVMLRQGWMAQNRGQHQEARRLFAESLNLRRALGDAWSEAGLLLELGELVHHVGEYAEALGYYQASLQIARKLDDRYAMSLCLDYAGYVARRMGNQAEARRQHMESMAISRDLGDNLGVAGSLDNLGMLAMDEGKLEDAARLFAEAKAMREGTDVTGGLTYSYEHMAMIAVAQGRWAEAEAHLRDLERLLTSRQFTLAPRTLNILADIRRGQGKLDEAERLHRQALNRSLGFSDFPTAMDSLVGLSSVSLAWGEVERAVRQLAHVAAHRTSEYATKQRAAKLLEEAARRMTPDAYRQAVCAGEDASTDAIVHAQLDLATPDSLPASGAAAVPTIADQPPG